MNRKILISLSVITLSLLTVFFLNNLGPDFYIKKQNQELNVYFQEAINSNECLVSVSLPYVPESNGCKITPYIKSYEISIFDTNPKTVIDVNGDFKADLVIFRDDQVQVSLSNGTSFQTAQKWTNHFTIKNGGWLNQNLHPRQLADVNGDNMADLVGFGNKSTFVSLSTGTSFGPPSIWINNFAKQSGWQSQDTHPRIFADVNGDNKADLVGFGNNATLVSLSTGSSFDNPSVWINNYSKIAGGWQSQNLHPRQLADVNNDNKADIIGFGNSSTLVSLSTGTSFSKPVSWLDNYARKSGWQNQNLYPRIMTYFQNNSEAGLIGMGQKNIFMSFSSNSSFTYPKPILKEFLISQGWANQNSYPRITADVNGDCKEDIIGFGAKNRILVSLGKGDGTFEEPTVWATLQ